MDHRLEHLGRGDRGLSAVERTEDDLLLQERHLGGTDLDAEIAARDHHRVGDVEDRSRAASTASLSSIFAITQAGEPAASIRDLSAATSVCGADERLRDVVDAECEREVEIGEVLVRQRRHGERDARDVHALVRLDDPARDDLAQRPCAVESLDA